MGKQGSLQNLNGYAVLSQLIDIAEDELQKLSDTLFGTLGLDSLIATRVRGRLSPEPSYQVLYGLTVAQIAEKINVADAFNELIEKDKIKQSDDAVPFRLTPMQESYVLGKNQNCPCQVYTEIDVEGLDIERFQKTLNSVIAHHSMLHAKIVNDTQQIIQHDSQNSTLVELRISQEKKLDERRRECMSTFQKNADRYWDIQLTQLNHNTVRIHLLLDMVFIDATSAMQLCKEVCQLYQDDKALSGTVILKPTHVEFIDYCNQLNFKEASEETLKYWNSRLQEIPGPPQLPRVNSVSEQGVNFQREATKLTRKHWSPIKQMARDIKVTLNALLLSVFVEVLKFYSEEEHFTVTVTMSERPVEPNNDFSGVVGEFTNVLLCPITEKTSNNIIEQAIDIHQNLSQSLEKSELGGLDIIRMLRKKYDDPQLTFPIVFTSFLGIVNSSLSLAGCKTSISYQQTQTPQIILDHQVYEYEEQLFINWDYDANILEPKLVREMLICFDELLKSLINNKQCIARLPKDVLERRKKTNETKHIFSTDVKFLLHELAIASSKKYPSSIAIIDQSIRLTYEEMITMARTIAVCFQDKGVSSGDCVAVILEKGWEQVVATLGILMVGAFYLPLNPSDPDDRLSKIMKLAQCRVALCHDKTLTSDRNWSNTESGDSITTIKIYRNQASHVGERQPFSVIINPDDLAYVIFTSGSTGIPKGVEISHRSAVNTCLDINERFGHQENTITFAVSSLSFDLSVWDIFGTLAAGGTIVVCKPDGTRDPDYWWQQIREHNITIWNTVPTSFEMLVAANSPGTIMPIKTALLSGDAISMNMVNHARLLFPNLTIVALGGATEASIWSNYHVVTDDSNQYGTELVPYGKPLSNQTMYVLDSNFAYRPTGVVGDIYIGGIGLARGYFGAPQLTADKFVIREPFGRLYATGDLGRYLPNGEIEIVGRKDSQVKVGGHRVELAEVEQCAEQLEAVKRASVIHIPGAGSRLVGFVTVNKGVDKVLLKENLCVHVEKHLPDYMATQNWIVIENIPLTANNKVDAKKLRQLAIESYQEDTDNAVKESDELVQQILNLAASILDIPVNVLSAKHSLAEQGLTSLYAVRLINLLAKQWNTKLSYTLVFNYPTAIKIAEYRRGMLSKNKSGCYGNSNIIDKSEPIAIIATACRLPKNVKSTGDFWEMLTKGTDCVTDVPDSRFDIDEFYEYGRDELGKSYTRRGAFMSQIESFDYEFFNVSIAEAETIDPQQRILLEVSYEAFYAAGYDKESLSGSSTGIFIGQMNYDWMMDFDFSKSYAGTGSAPSITSNRISFTLDLIGPSMTIDTACSSSLVAVDTAVNYLRSGACEMALVGGVNLILSGEPYITTCQARMLSVDSRCATFDAEANGIVRGEGVGVVVLKRLSQAKADGNPILAVIRGSAVTQDGRSASLIAPNGLSQEEVIRRALNTAGLSGGEVDYVECHGTGTPLGDPIEVEALKQVLNVERKKSVVLGAVKTNFGHLEGAAGIIGLIKTVEVLRHD